MDGKQSNLYQFLEESSVDLLSVESLKEGREAKQVFNHLRKRSYLLPDIRVEEFDNLQSYRYEIFEAINYIYSSREIGGTLIVPESTMSFPFPKNIDSFQISFGDKWSSDLINKLLFWGYREVDMVEEMGQFSFHNTVLDIFPIGSESPYRIELLESQVETISGLSIDTQLSDGDEVESIKIVSILNLTEDQREDILEDIENLDTHSLSKELLSFGFWFLGDLGQKLSEKEHTKYSEIELYEKLLNIELNSIHSKKMSQKRSIMLLDEISEGDYIVHSEYGIGLFEEMEQGYVLGGVRDFIKLKYRGDNRLLIPIDKLHLISRYISATGKAPVVDSLGKGGFSKIKGKIKDKLFEIADKIIEVTAERKRIKAPQITSFSLRDFQREAGFTYTDDQKRSISEISNNLKKPYPMDHILIGDVGFGKTEVALNATKIVTASKKQVALIVPTALLAKQHYQTAVARFGDSLKIAHIDRFLKLKEKRAIKRGVESGEIELIIGTHSIFDFVFKDLGLVIIDEEHRFGVKQKSKLQELYRNSHHLSMSATPIPRTLHQALSSLKTISKLETPPAGRKSVRTDVIEYSIAEIKSIIHRELQRGGQVLYIFNNIEFIEMKRKELQQSMPDLRVLVLHSKVPSKETEEGVIKFSNGEYDLLLSTSIVGTGIHIPTLNSVIVDNSDRFGIAELHQFRGRVGRGEVEGFCYFVVEDRLKITEKATKRLIALQESSELGSGSALAQHDLEIRGGGNLIGEAQSGHIDKIGYSLYIKLLEEEIAKQTVGKVESSEIDIQLSVKAYLSADLIREERVRLNLYRRASEINSLDEVDKLNIEIENRFGKLDLPSEQFLQLIKVKYLSEKVGVKSLKSYQRAITVVLRDETKLTLQAESSDDDDILREALDFLMEMQKQT
jgi:transcription-repair coupling factor (superfamily II helicase)